MVVVLLDVLLFISRGERQLAGLAHPLARGRVDIDLEDSEPLARGLLPVEHDLVGVEVQIEAPEDTLLHFGDQVRDLARP